MKPSDFFIGSREFFGALIPGLIWLAAAVLIFINVSIHKMLVYASNTNWIGALSFAGLALLVGTLLQSRSFSFSRMVHKFLREAEQPNSKYPRIKRFLSNHSVKRYFGEPFAPMSYRSALFEQAEKKIRGNIKSVYPNLKGEHFDPTDQLYQGERQIFTACKRSVLARSPELGHLLKEKEVEVNLIGTLPLPLFFFALGLLLHSRDISELPLRVNHLSWLWSFGIVAVALVAVIHLLLRFHALRKEEVRMCLESFFLIGYGMAENRKPDDLMDANADKE
jgi:hypothetical protein